MRSFRNIVLIRRALMRRVPTLLAVNAALIASLSPAVHAQTDFDTNGATIGVVAGIARVGFNTPSPTPLTVYANSGTNVGNGLRLYNDATLNMSGGVVAAEVFVYNNSVLNLSGGNLGFVFAYDASMINMTGGDLTYLYAFYNSVVNISGGTISLDLLPYHDRVVNVRGGSVSRNLTAVNNSVTNVSGGSIADNVWARDNSVINVSGGTLGGELRTLDSGVIALLGSGLNAALVNPDANGYTQYSLSGLLTDGTDIAGKSIFVENNGTASFRIINAAAAPEPGTLALLGAGVVLGILVRKRK